MNLNYIVPGAYIVSGKFILMDINLKGGVKIVKLNSTLIFPAMGMSLKSPELKALNYVHYY